MNLFLTLIIYFILLEVFLNCSEKYIFNFDKSVKMGRKCMAYKCSYLKDDLKIRETNKERVSNDLPEIPPIKLF